MSLAYTGRVPPSAAAARVDPAASPRASKRAARQQQMVSSARKPKGTQAKKEKLQAETFSVAAMNKKKAKATAKASQLCPSSTERLSFRFWAKDDFAIAKQLWGDDRVTELIGGPFAVLPLGKLLERARLKGASDEQMDLVESEDDLVQKEMLVHLISECELAQAHLHAELSPSGVVQELREQAVQLRLDAEITRQREEGVQLYPVFLLDPMPELLTPGAGNVGCVGLRDKDISSWIVEVHSMFGAGVTKAYEMGFHVRPPYWRRGLGTEAATAVLHHAFEKLKADMIIASYHQDNVPARQLLRKLGFQYVGIDVYHEVPNPIDEAIDAPRPPEPEEEARPQSKSSRRSVATPRLELEPEPEPELNHGLGLTGMFGWGNGRPTYVMLRSEHRDKIEAEADFPALEKLFETMTGIGEGSEFYLKREIREEGWTLRDLQRRVQRAGFPPDGEPYQQAMSADDPMEAIVHLLVENTLYHTKVQIMQAVVNGTNALCSLLCAYLDTKLSDDDANTRHRALLIIEACAGIPQASAFRRQLRAHCIESVGKMVDHAAADGRQTEQESILHNHATVLLKQIFYQAKDEVEVFVPTAPADIFAAMDKDGDGEVDKAEFAAAMREQRKNVRENGIFEPFIF
jgi:RimJ/RimL family protein N-acetyltransferase